MRRPNRALWVVLTLWRKRGDEYVREKILSSDHRLLDDTQIVLGEFVLPTASSPSISPPLAFFDNGFALESVDLPEHAQAGATLNITSSWRADQLGREDYVQLLHLGNEESGEWIVYDQSPLGQCVCRPASGTLDSLTAKPGACRCRRILRRDAMRSLPAYTALATWSGFQRKTPRVRPGLIIAWSWAALSLSKN